MRVPSIVIAYAVISLIAGLLAGYAHIIFSGTKSFIYENIVNSTYSILDATITDAALRSSYSSYHIGYASFSYLVYLVCSGERDVCNCSRERCMICVERLEYCRDVDVARLKERLKSYELNYELRIFFNRTSGYVMEVNASKVESVINVTVRMRSRLS